MGKAKVYGHDKLTLNHTDKKGGAIERTVIRIKFVKSGNMLCNRF